MLNAFAVATEGAEGLGRTVSTSHPWNPRPTSSLLETRPVGRIRLVELDLHLAGEYPTHLQQTRVLLVRRAGSVDGIVQSERLDKRITVRSGYGYSERRRLDIDNDVLRRNALET